jgi:hypothetical protein
MHQILLACITTILFVKEDVGNRRKKLVFHISQAFYIQKQFFLIKPLNFKTNVN